MLMTEMTQKRRDKLVIMAEIMDIAKTGALKTQIMYKANLSFSQLNQYLSILVAQNLLEIKKKDNKKIYRATAKGLEYVNKQNEVIMLLDNHFIKSNSITYAQLPVFNRHVYTSI